MPVSPRALPRNQTGRRTRPKLTTSDSPFVDPDLHAADAPEVITNLIDTPLVDLDTTSQLIRPDRYEPGRPLLELNVVHERDCFCVVCAGRLVDVYPQCDQ